MTQHQSQNLPWRSLALSTAIAAALAAAAPAATYYVSPTGNDDNSGLDPSSPWRSVSKVNATAFTPGSQILFQRGGEWRESLVASSDGVAGAPITYDAYGSGAKPKFWGSELLDKSTFQLVAGSSSTFSIDSGNPINSVLLDHQFSRSARLLTKTTDAATNLAYVKANPNTWFYDAGKLYLNTGGVNPASDPRAYTAAIREDVVRTNGKDYLVFRNLVADESAKVDGGYAFRVEFSDNVTIEASEAYRAGKHHFGVIDSTGFVGRNLLAAIAMPDQGYGGASSYVSYSDHSRSGDTSQWIDSVAENSWGGYPGFITHGSGMGDILIKNMTIRGGAGMAIYTEGANQHIRIEGGTVENGPLVIDSNVTIDGITMTGALGAIRLDGHDNVIENSRLIGRITDYWAGHQAAITDSGLNNIIRYNTIDLADVGGIGAGIGILNPASNSQIYGNLFADIQAILVSRGYPPMSSDNNSFSPDSIFALFQPTGVVEYYTLQQWQALGYDLNSVIGASAGSEPGYHGEQSDVPEPSSVVILAASTCLLLRHKRRR